MGQMALDVRGLAPAPQDLGSARMAGPRQDRLVQLRAALNPGAATMRPRVRPPVNDDAALGRGSTILQMVKGDPEDPHTVPFGHVILKHVEEAVLVVGVAGCVAMKINLFQVGETETLVGSYVLHSEGLNSRTKESIQEINADIAGKTKEGEFRATVLVLYNGMHERAAEHSAVTGLIEKPLSDRQIITTIRRETIKSDQQFIDIDVSGTEQDILARFGDKLVKPPIQELVQYRMARFRQFKSDLAKSGYTTQSAEPLIRAWPKTQSIAEVDELVASAKVSQKKSVVSDSCIIS